MKPVLEARLVHIGAAVAVAVAAVGLVTSYQTEPLRWRLPAAAAAPATGLPRAPHYADARQRHSDNRLRHAGNLVALRPGLATNADAGLVTAEQRTAALAARARRRAYDGAPPTIPHPIAQRDWPNCTTCHGDGMRLSAQHTAPAMSHAPYGSCVQCHVVSEGPVPGAPPPAGPMAMDNSFVGLESAGAGPRAWPGAPPQIPHPTLMRSRCESCHGQLALGLRTSHPWRQSCTQCHTPSAALDQRPVLAEAP